MAAADPTTNYWTNEQFVSYLLGWTKFRKLSFFLCCLLPIETELTKPQVRTVLEFDWFAELNLQDGRQGQISEEGEEEWWGQCGGRQEDEVFLYLYNLYFPICVFRKGPADKRIFVSNLPYEMKWQEVKDLFRQEVGEVGLFVFVFVFVNLFLQVSYVELFNDESGKPRGAGVMEFPTQEMAKLAIDKMHRFGVYQ